MQVKSSQAVRMITAAFKAKLVPFVKGSPGIGKSQIIQQIAEEYNLMLIDFRLSQCDPTDLQGFPNVTNGRADYFPMRYFPLEGDPVPPGYSGWLLFLDEANSAIPAVQAAAYKLVLDRMIGSHKLHKNVAIALAGNLDTDGAITHTMSTALESRLVHMELMVDAKEWDEWATTKGKIHHHITSGIRFKPGWLYTFSPDHTDCTYACPRTWEFASRILETVEPNSPDLLPLLSGTLSEGIAREFITWLKIYDKLLTVEKIQTAPKTVKVPDEPAILHAITGTIAHNLTEENAEPLVTFVDRMPLEFQVFCLKEACRRNPKALKFKAVRAWIDRSSVNLF